MKTYVIPTSGEPLPYPGGTLPPEGDWVVIDQFWRRRLADQDVTTGKPPAEAPSAATVAAGTAPDGAAESAAEPATKKK